MLRSFLLLLIALLSSGEAYAFSPEGATALLTDFGGHHGFSLGIFGIDTSRSTSLADERSQQTQTSAVELTWSRGGFSVGLTVGSMTYAEYLMSGAFVGSANLTGIRVGHEITDVAGGAVAAEFTAQRTYLKDSFSDLMTFNLRWSRRF